MKDTYSEKDLENALLREIESFLLELGSGFAFVERQKRITLDVDDYYIDLLFYHRRMRRLVVIELKIGDFKPADAGQVELYLRWLDRYERQEGEDKPLGLYTGEELFIMDLTLPKQDVVGLMIGFRIFPFDDHWMHTGANLTLGKVRDAQPIKPLGALKSVKEEQNLNDEVIFEWRQMVSEMDA